jgi:polyphosphate kinase 2 (PPK2 family)
MAIDLADYEQDEDLDREIYAARLVELQHKLEQIQAAYINHNQRAIIAIEGWDAAGKGGLITRLIGTLDHRYTKVWSIGAPTPTEAAHHYLWRFWQRVPGNREIAVFDRTWYGRVLVERVDGFASAAEWQRAYDEINAFEALHIAEGTRVIKLFLHISQAEQDKRLKERIETPWKRWKTGLDDYHNRSKRPEYLRAYHEMFERTATAHAPWHVIAASDKKWARIRGLEIVAEALAHGVDLDYPKVDPALKKVAEAALGKKLDLQPGVDLPK